MFKKLSGRVCAWDGCRKSSIPGALESLRSKNYISIVWIARHKHNQNIGKRDVLFIYYWKGSFDWLLGQIILRLDSVPDWESSSSENRSHSASAKNTLINISRLNNITQMVRVWKNTSDVAKHGHVFWQVPLTPALCITQPITVQFEHKGTSGQRIKSKSNQMKQKTAVK